MIRPPPRASHWAPTKTALALRRACFFGVTWIGLTGAEPGALPIGAAAVAGATWLSLRLRPRGARSIRATRAARLVPGFLGRSFLAGIDVARRAFDPRLPLAPGWFTVPTRIPEGGPRVVLGGEFSLMPGTLVAGARGDTLRVHVLDRNGDVLRQLEAGEAQLFKALDEAES